MSAEPDPAPPTPPTPPEGTTPKSPSTDGGSDDGPPSPAVPSFGNMSEHHWSKTRGERNREAIDYYRERSKAPGVAEGGSERNFYCMECDGVVPFDESETCPHCGASLEGMARRYFNWVEIDRPAEGDFRAVLPWLLGAAVLLAVVLWQLLSFLL